MEHLPKDGPDGMPGSDANDVDKVRDAVDSSEAMEVDDVALKSPCIGREAGGFGWTRLLDDEENGKMDSDDALEYTVSSKQQSSAAADAQPAMLSERAQWDVSACINSSKVAMSDPQARRLYRRLQLRRFKRMLGLQSFDIDSTVKECMRRRQRVWSTRDEDSRNVAGDMTMPSSDNREMMLAGTTASIEGHEDGYQQDISSIHDVSGESSRAGSLGMQGQSVSGALGGAQSSDDAAKNMKESGELVSVTPYVHSFASRLLGRAVLRDSLTSPVARVSPYHGRLLRPFIWRDWIKTDNSERASDVLEPAMLWMHRSIRSRQHKVFGKLEFVREDNICEALNGGESIDYVYFQEEHVDQVNALLSRTFWSGVDVREALMYPEFTVVALYKRLVIGCAFLTPDAYLTYIAVSSGWAGAGIAKFMLYHLTQTVPTKDVTLHVSANNAAMVLYQQFGFKPEKYVVNFYKSYLPESSRLSANAFFMRLRRY
ncbi:hypothetical protein EV178_001412 [Coemansia sp. RSA 1646]|nr:hypothetical protein EV178_001412 [Coemansia sp. RSA 1646]